MFDWPKAGALCPKEEVVCPKGELVGPSEGVVDWNNGDDCVLPKLKPEPNDGVVACADDEPKIEVDVPKAGALEEPKSEEEVLAPKEGLGPNREGVDDDVEPKGFDVVEAPKGEEPNAEDEAPKPELLKAGVFCAKGLEDEEDEKGLADDWPKAGVEEDPNPEAPKPIAAVD